MDLNVLNTMRLSIIFNVSIVVICVALKSKMISFSSCLREISSTGLYIHRRHDKKLKYFNLGRQARAGWTK